MATALSVRQRRAGHPTITSFTRVSKPAPTPDSTTKSAITVDIPLVLNSRKRKAFTELDEKLVEAVELTRRVAKKPCQQLAISLSPIIDNPVPAIPQMPGQRKRAISTLECYDASETGALFKRLKLESSVVDKDIGRLSQKAGVPITAAKVDVEVPLPQALLDLVQLEASLFKTLAVHYAHTGTNTPVDLRTLSPIVAQAWGKRRLSVADFRRCIGVLEATGTTTTGRCRFFMAQYGQGRTCIELQPEFIGIAINEQSLVKLFELNLRRLWHEASCPDPASFMLKLPKASIKPCEPLVNINPILAKGQSALAELKRGVAAKQEAQAAQIVARTAPQPGGIRTSLLDRIRIRQEQAALSGAGPSVEELAREAALHRAEDVAAVIGMLSTSTTVGQGRVSYTVTVLLQKLKDSLRVPISNAEAVNCIKVLAEEVVPEWIKVIKIGTQEHVVLQAASAPSRGLIRQRVRDIRG